MTQENVAPETLEFRTEVQQLLNILAHSLYTEREIFLRELISNASDALNRMQYELLTNRDVLDPDAELAIRLEFDDKAHTLTISDSGVGMTRDELVENLGTIAHSGAMAFLKGLQEGERPGDIIGQFGVGFYSVFMVAEEVAVTTRSYRPESTGWRWVSTGDNRFAMSPAERDHRGTSIDIKLTDDAYEFASAWRLEQIVKKHSNYVSFPIYLQDRVVNQRAAPWRKPLNAVQEGEYEDFYRQLTLDPEKPLAHLHVITDAPVDIRSILYVPAQFEHSPMRLRSDYGLRLYSKNVLIQEHTKDLLPEYLRFVEGVVDSEDLPLNISRETVQSNRVVRQIQKVLTGRVLKALREMAQERPDDYRRFWEECGPFLKQGAATSPGDHDGLLPLLRFYSSKSDGALVSLADYVARMVADQQEIYYVLGNDRATVETSPHLDAFRARDLEVLYLLDPFDGFMVQSVREFEGKRFHNVDDPALELPQRAKSTETSESAGEEADLSQLIDRCRTVLGGRVSDVRTSSLLTGSPCRLVSPGTAADRDLERVRRLLEQDYQAPPKILELNPHHPIVQNLNRLVVARPEDRVIDTGIEQLFENLLLLEGLHPNPAEMVPRIQALLEAATRGGEE